MIVEKSENKICILTFSKTFAEIFLIITRVLLIMKNIWI